MKKDPEALGGIVFVCVKVPLNPRKVFRCKEIFLSKATLPKNLKRKKCEKTPTEFGIKKAPSSSSLLYILGPPPTL